MFSVWLLPNSISNSFPPSSITQISLFLSPDLSFLSIDLQLPPRSSCHLKGPIRILPHERCNISQKIYNTINNKYLPCVLTSVYYLVGKLYAKHRKCAFFCNYAARKVPIHLLEFICGALGNFSATLRSPLSRLELKKAFFCYWNQFFLTQKQSYGCNKLC